MPRSAPAWASTPTRILPIVTETPASVLQLSTYIGASSRTVGMSWGAEDLSAVVGSLSSRTPAGALTSPYRLVRDLCLLTAAAADVQPIDTVFVNFRDYRGTACGGAEAARDGFTGKIAIHPDQVGADQRGIHAQRRGDRARRRRLLVSSPSNPAAGVASLNGVMLDRPHLKLAQKVLARAKAAGVAVVCRYSAATVSGMMRPSASTSGRLIVKTLSGVTTA